MCVCVCVCVCVWGGGGGREGVWGGIVLRCPHLGSNWQVVRALIVSSTGDFSICN